MDGDFVWHVSSRPAEKVLQLSDAARLGREEEAAARLAQGAEKQTFLCTKRHGGDAFRGLGKTIAGA